MSNKCFFAFPESRVTRSKTGSLTPRTFTDSISPATSSIKFARKEVPAQPSSHDNDGIVTRTRANFQASSDIIHSAYFRLGIFLFVYN